LSRDDLLWKKRFFQEITSTLIQIEPRKWLDNEEKINAAPPPDSTHLRSVPDNINRLSVEASYLGQCRVLMRAGL